MELQLSGGDSCLGNTSLEDLSLSRVRCQTGLEEEYVHRSSCNLDSPLDSPFLLPSGVPVRRGQQHL